MKLINNTNTVGEHQAIPEKMLTKKQQVSFLRVAPGIHINMVLYHAGILGKS